MPRHTAKQYLQDRQWLVTLWLVGHRGFGELSARRQWDLRAFYAPSDDLTDTQALEFRQRVSLENPSLPQRAGRAMAKLRAHGALVRSVMVSAASPCKKLRRGPVVVKSVVRPQADVDAMAIALRRIATDISRLYD